MAVFKVQAVNPDTGQEQWVEVEAFTPDMAEDEVNEKGLVVGKVQVADELPPDAPVFEIDEGEPERVRIPASNEAVHEAAFDTAFDLEPAPLTPAVTIASSLPAPKVGALIFVSAMLRVAGVFLAVFGVLCGWAVFRALGADQGLPLSGAYGLGCLVGGAIVGLCVFAFGQAIACLVGMAVDLRAIRAASRAAGHPG